MSDELQLRIRVSNQVYGTRVEDAATGKTLGITRIVIDESVKDGGVKWDGCSNWAFHPADNCMVHLCCPEDADELAWLIKQCYRFALELKNFTEYEMPETL